MMPNSRVPKKISNVSQPRLPWLSSEDFFWFLDSGLERRRFRTMAEAAKYVGGYLHFTQDVDNRKDLLSQMKLTAEQDGLK